MRGAPDAPDPLGTAHAAQRRNPAAISICVYPCPSVVKKMNAHGKFLTHLLLTPLKDGRNWRVEMPFAYASGWGWHVTVPVNFETDLASIPKLFWNILPPFGKYTEAAVIHDWLYRTHLIPRADADDILLEAMRLCNVPDWQRAIIYVAVRTFGWHAWRNEKRWISHPRNFARSHPSPA